MTRPLFSACSLIAMTLLAWQAPAATAQVVFGNGGGVMIFGQPDGSEAAQTQPDPSGAHVIEFFDGRRFHGTLEALDLARRELTWRRSDASAPLVIPLLQVTRLSFGQPAHEAVLHATIKFTGGDWLAAEITRIQDNKIQLQLADGSALTVNRAQIDWIYFSKSTAPECYEGPTSLSGWVSGGGWSYRDGALRASMPSQLARNFAALPDQVEYQFELDQGNLMSAFNLTLHGRSGRERGFHPGVIQFSMRANTLNVMAMSGGKFESKQVDLNDTIGGALDGRKKPGKSNPVQFRVLEDFPAGRLLVFVDGRKVGEWNVDKGEPGKNGGGFVFQPSVWNSNREQTLTKIRIAPWDGREPGETAKGDTPSGDLVSLADGTTREGKFIDLALGTFRVRVDNSTYEATRDQLRMLRFGGAKEAADAAPSVARIRLAQGGEFDAAEIGWRDGKLQIRTHFGSEVTVPAKAVTELRFSQTPPMLGVAEDLLVFKNGDRLQGRLEAADGKQKLRWRTNESEAVDFDLTHLAGVRLSSPQTKPSQRIDCVARFRNGDWLAGRFLTLDKDALVLDTQDAGQLTIARKLIRALYFSRDGSLPISDGVSDDQEWLRGLDLTNAGVALQKKSSKPANAWRCFDGSYSLAASENDETIAMRGNAIHIGREMETLPALVEVSFDATGQAGQVLFTAQLFSEAGNPGYLMQFHSQGLYIYDLNPGVRGRGGIVPQQTQFDDKLKPNANQRHIQLLANRDTGQLTVLVDGLVVAHFGAKMGAPARALGHGLMLSPQPGMRGSFSNIWVGPWNGRLPGIPLDADPAQATAVLRNGDEAQGTVEIATPSTVKLASEIGPLDLAVDRLTMIDFGGPPPERSPGTRLHLAALGALTVSSCRIENDTVTCRSEVAGELKLPLSAMQEVVFPSSVAPKE